MDPLSHALIGGLSAKSLKVSKRRFWIMTLLGMAPDLDVLGNFLGGWAFMFQHRGITHSVVGLVLQSFFYAWVLSRWDQGPFRERAVHYSIPIGAHILADLLTCFGVPLLAPFSFKEYSIDLIGSLNLIPLILMALGIWWLHQKNRHGWRETRLLWAMWAIYLAVALTEKAYAAKIIHDSSIVALPKTIQSLNWRAVQLDPDHQKYRTFSVDLLKGQSQELPAVPMPSKAWPVQASLASAGVQRFLKENRWPVVRFVQQEDQWLVDWGTLLFSTRGLVRGKVRVQISPDGKILSEKKIVAFWNP